jgi:hypothetical protein
MRSLLPLGGLFLCLACGEKVEHPAAAADCDPAVTNCNQVSPPRGSVNGGGNEGGAGSEPEQTATWTGHVVAYQDDYFDKGAVFPGQAEVSAIGQSGARVQGHFDGTSFELQDVVKDDENWFMVEPAAGQGMLTTVTPVDTRAVKMDQLVLGLASEENIDGIYALSQSGGERNPQTAQIVLRVTDAQGRSIKGVSVSLIAEMIIYRVGDQWLSSDGATDDSGLVLLGNVPATAALGRVNITLLGTVEARVEARIIAGGTTVLSAVVASP